MRILTDLGSDPGLTLQHVLLVYSKTDTLNWEFGEKAESGPAAYVIAAKAAVDDAGEVTMQPYQPVTMEFVQALAKGMGVDLPREILPPNVLCRTQEIIVWWTPPGKRDLFFGDETPLAELSGDTFPVPALVWRLDLKDKRLFVRALQGEDRPDMGTQLFVAPFLNVYNGDLQRGLVCQGTMKRPSMATAQNLAEWEAGFFGAEGSSQLAERATAVHPSRGHLFKVWRTIRRRSAFPDIYLLEAGETLGDFIRRSR